MRERAKIICGDVFDELAKFPPGHFDAILCDPPYFFEFMNREFDSQHKTHESPRLDLLKAAFGGKLTDDLKAIAWHADWLELGLPTLRPGGRLAAATGSRVYHQLATGAALAGFNVDPMFCHIHGEAMAQGMAIDKGIDKAAGAEREVVGRDSNWRKQCHSALVMDGGQTRPQNITAPATSLAKLFEGYATRLKDALGPWVMAHKANVGTWAGNAEEQGLAGLNIEAGRVPTSIQDAAEMERCNTPGSGRLRESIPSELYGKYGAAKRFDTNQGRYPSNLSLSNAAAEVLDQQSGTLKSGASRPGRQRTHQVTHGAPGVDRSGSVHPNGDTGGASRFFHRFRYQAKAASSERLLGCENFFWRVDRDHPLGFQRITKAEWLAMGHLPGCVERITPKSDTPSLFEIAGVEPGEIKTGCAPGCQYRQRYQGNTHPTLKPIELIKYLAKLILPPATGRPRRVLVPFAGTMSEAIGCALAGWDEVIAIEAEPVYCEIGEARCDAWLRDEHQQQSLIG